MDDHYKTLQVDPNADSEVIRAAYKRLARTYHPDISTASDARDRMASINRAYEVLANPVTRRAFDAERSAASWDAARAASEASPPPSPPAPTHTTAETAEIAQLRVLAEQGDASAQNTLGVIYELGLGVPQDFGQAGGWFRQAAEQGEAEAQHNLGLLYGKGRCVPKDMVTAHMWVSLAAARATGNTRKEFADTRDVLARSMTPEAVANALSRARTWTEAFELRQEQRRRPDPPGADGASDCGLATDHA